MAQVKIQGDAFTVSTVLTKKELVNLQKFDPKNLKLFDENNKNEVFAIGVGSEPSLSEFGIVFTSENEEGKASATFLFDETGLSYDERKAVVADECGKAILKLNQLEEVLSARLASFNTAIAEIETSIN